MRITVEMLEEADACSNQVDLFERFLGGRKYIYLTEKNVNLAEQYGLDISWFLKTFRDQLQGYRECFLGSPYIADLLSFIVDRGQPRADTRKAMLESPCFALRYARYIDQCGREDTRTVANQQPYYAFGYAVHVDRAPRDDTRKAAHKCRIWGDSYDRWEKEFGPWK